MHVAARRIAFLLIALVWNSAVATAAEPARPNVLFIAIDDLNDWIGVLGGYPGVKTPNLDKLAARSVLFTKAYCSAPACNPSRASLMCGVRPSTSGVYHNSQPWHRAMPDAVTLSQQFMQAGYRVEGGGKIFHNAFNDRASWQKYVEHGRDPVPDRVPVSGIPNTAHFDWGPVSAGDEQMGDAKVVDWAMSFLGEPQDKPFFLAAGMIRPHLPWYVPQKYFDMYPLADIKRPQVLDTDLDDVPPLGLKMAGLKDHQNVTSTDNWEKAIQGYLASITFTDGQVGRLLDALEQSPHADNTIIVLWSDHGWHLGEKQHWRKFALWEEATRVTFMVAAPGVTPTSARCDRTVTLLDVYPTLLELCALPAAGHVEGHSIVPLLRDPSIEWNHPAVTTHGRGNHAVRNERWRYIRYADGTEELYDHDADPLEWKNLAGAEPHAKIKQELATFLPTDDAPDAATGRRRQRDK